MNKYTVRYTTRAGIDSLESYGSRARAMSAAERARADMAAGSQVTVRSPGGEAMVRLDASEQL